MDTSTGPGPLPILRARHGSTEVITLNRPEAANSMNRELLVDLGRALQDVLDDDDARGRGAHRSR